MAANQDKPAEVIEAKAGGLVGPHVPPLNEYDPNPKAGPGQVVVTSPTGYKSVVDESAVDSLKPQGYKVG